MTEGSDDSDLYRRHESTVERAVSHSGLGRADREDLS
jgi:hypothetical protein